MNLAGRWKSLIPGSLYARITAAYLLLTSFLVVAQIVIFFWLWTNYMDESQQLLYWDLAREMAEQLEPQLQGGIAPVEMQKALYRMSQLTPSVDPYILKANGEVLVALGNGTFPPVEVAPLEAFLHTVGTPETRLKVRYPSGVFSTPEIFSVARLKVGEERGYLFLALKGLQQTIVLRTFGDMYTVRLAVLNLLGSLAVTSGVGLIVFFYLTRNFNRISATIERFERGDLDVRATPRGGDEVAHVGRAFNRMADTIVATIAQLEHTDQLRRELLENVSHDVRRPISVTQAMLETFLMRKAELSESEQSAFIERILKNFKSVDRLLDDLFQLSKLNADEVRPVPEHLQLDSFVEDIVERFRHLADARRIALRLRSESPATTDTDPALFDRLLSNLIENAILYTQEKGEVNIEIRQGAAGPEVTVRDSGIGIARSDLPHIFERFYRAQEARTRQLEGSGLGLAIVKKIAETLEIDLSVESAVGVGTTFHLRFRDAAGVAPVSV